MRDRRGRYTDEEVEAIEHAVGFVAPDQEELDRMAATGVGQAAVIEHRARVAWDAIERESLGLQRQPSWAARQAGRFLAWWAAKVRP